MKTVEVIRGNRFVGLHLGRLTLTLLLTLRWPPNWAPFFFDRRQRLLRLGWLTLIWRTA